jgi:ATP-dependent Lhr-like helicase
VSDLGQLFHPLVWQWFQKRFGEPTEPQRRGWPIMARGEDILIAAPTGFGKTLAALLCVIDRLLHAALEGQLPQKTVAVYVSPLRALSNDLYRNLQLPLSEIRELATSAGLNLPEIRVAVRTGDTLPSERQRLLKKPPQILVTTPESLFLLLTAARSRPLLTGVETVIVDEIHALARDKRGSHLALSLERLDALTGRPVQRVGLSATQRPISEMAAFLVGAARVDEQTGEPRCSVVDVGHLRDMDLQVLVPPVPLSAVCSKEMWAHVYRLLEQLIRSHGSTVVFVNTRRLAERVAEQLRQTLGEDAVASHHGSLARELRFDVEQRLKEGRLKAIVATASLELGIDVGHIDLVCQIGSPRSISTFLQRVGRSGHTLGQVPKGRLLPLTRDELLECLALARAVYEGKLDALTIPSGSLDILAQQIVAAVAAEGLWGEEELYQLVRRAWPYRELSREDFDAVVRILSEGIGTEGRRGAWLHRDRIHGRLRPRRGARLAALTSGGAIPEQADYPVYTEEPRRFLGTVNEDFALESCVGDVFLLGNRTWEVRHVRGGEMVVTDAQGRPATIPFWLGEAPARTAELSHEVSRLREELATCFTGASDAVEFLLTPASGGAVGGEEPDSSATTEPRAEELAEARLVQLQARCPEVTPAVALLTGPCRGTLFGCWQALAYVAAQLRATGFVPTQNHLLWERFFDDTGGMQVVIHAPFGARVNRAWGLALRKAFCRRFDFELQASADDDGIVLSVGPQHSFPLEELVGLVTVERAAPLLEQALLASPLFRVRWRWNANRSLAVLRWRNGRKVPPALQRFQADDLLTSVFPAQTACFENRPPDLPVPDHPLVRQTLVDCLTEAVDLPGWLQVLEDLRAGRAHITAMQTREPSPFSHRLLNANPYAFLDDAPLEERRARAVATRRLLEDASLRDLGALDPAVTDQVRAEAWPVVRSDDELHDALLALVAIREDRAPAGWSDFFPLLAQSGRATRVRTKAGVTFLTATEMLPVLRAVYGNDVAVDPAVLLPPGLAETTAPEEALAELLAGALSVAGPVTVGALAEGLALPQPAVEAAL